MHKRRPRPCECLILGILSQVLTRRLMTALFRTDTSLTVPSPSQSPSPGPSGNSGHLDAIIGGAAGGAIALILLLLTLFLLRERRLRNLSRERQPSVFILPGPQESSIIRQSQGLLQPISARIRNMGPGIDDTRNGSREKSESTQSDNASAFRSGGYTNGQLGNGSRNDSHENLPQAASIRYVSPAPSPSPPRAASTRRVSPDPSPRPTSVMISQDDTLIQSISRTIMAQGPARPFKSTPNQPPGLVGNSPPAVDTSEEPPLVVGNETTERDIQLAGALVNLIRAVRGEGVDSSGTSTGMAPPAYREDH
jgi:hypothetical protein